MRAVLQGRAALLALTAGAALHAPAGARQQPLDLSALTVPAARLAAGCGFAPKEEKLPNGRVRMVGVAIPTNPWRGTDRYTLAAIRQGHSAPALTPDGPPPSARDARRMFLRLADGVSEAYAAFYRAADEQTVASVYALRFEDTSDAQAWAANKEHEGTPFVAGSTVVAVEGRTSRCFTSVRQYVEGAVTGRGGQTRKALAAEYKEYAD